MNKRRFFPVFYIIIMLFSLALPAKGDYQKTKELIAKLTGNKNTVSARMTAATVLARDGSPRAIADLFDMLKNDSDHNVKNAVLQGMKKIGGETLMEALKIVMNDKSSRVQAKAVNILAGIGTPEAFALMVKAFDSHFMQGQDAAIRQLKKMGSPEAIDALCGFLKDGSKNHRFRAKAADALSETGSDKAVTALIDVLQSDDDHMIRKQAVLSLGNIRKPQVEDVLIDTLKNSDLSYLRSAACTALGKLGTDRAIAVLIETLQDKSWSIMRDAFEALEQPLKTGNRNADKIIAGLVGLYERNRSRSFRQSILKLLRSVGTARAKEALAEIREI